MYNNYFDKIIEFIKFSFVGGAMTILGIVLFWIFNEFIHINYIVSNALSYTISVVLSYAINSQFTFNEKGITRKKHFQKLLAFFWMKLILLGVDSLLLILLVEKLHVNKYIGKIIITIALLIFSYPLSSKIIKKKKDA